MEPSRPARLLVVDDNADNRDILGRRLQRQGHGEVAYAADGLEAWERLQEGPYDAVLLDVMMPRLNGVELLERMRAAGMLEETPVIMISAATEMETVVRCIEAGAEDYLPKPFNPTLLRARLGSVLEKRALRAATRAHLAALERDLAEARNQQLSMVPTEFPDSVGGRAIAVQAAMFPARQVGGDLYDCFALPSGTLCVAVGDVSGKGMPAALFMARARSLLRAIAMHIADSGRTPSASEVATLMNRELCLNNPTGMFVTLFLGFLDGASLRLDFVLAGHPRPFRLRAGDAVTELVAKASLPIGIIEDGTWPGHEAMLEPGDTLVMITDGLPEATAPDGSFYTLTRVAADLEALRDLAPAALIPALCERIVRFTDTAEQADDVTAMAVRLG